MSIEGLGVRRKEEAWPRSMPVARICPDRLMSRALTRITLLPGEICVLRSIIFPKPRMMNARLPRGVSA